MRRCEKITKLYLVGEKKKAQNSIYKTVNVHKEVS